MSDLEIYRPRRASLMQRIGQAIRSYTLGPLSLKDPEIRKYFQGGETSTGVSVSEYTAMNYSAVWSAVKLVSGDVAGQPLVLYRRNGTGKERYEGHPLYRLLHDAPNPEMSSLTFRQTLQAHALTWGNGYAEIERDAAGRPRNLWPLTPDRVHPDRDNGRLVYRVTNPGSRDTTFEAADMLHIPGLGWDGMQGYGVIAKARESVAMGLAAERFGGKFYGNGSTFGGTITHPTKFATPQARENFEKALRNRSQGVERAHGLLLLEEGMTYAQMGIPPDQAQFLESRAFQVTEIARWFNVPPHKIGDLSRATFSNIEQQNIEYVQTTLVYWFEAWEQELMRKLISPLERNQQFIEHIVEGLLRGDSVGRAALQSAEFQIGGLTPNESRALANRNPVAGGDRAFVQMNMMPLDRMDEWIDAQIESLKPKPPATPPASGGRDAETVAEIRALAESVTKVHGELAEAHKANAELVDDITAAKVGQESLRAEVAAEKGLRTAVEEQNEALTEQLAVGASLLKDAEERLAIATATVAEREAQLEGERAASATTRAVLIEEKTAHDATRQSERDAVGAAMRLQVELDEARTAQAHLAELLDGAQAALAEMTAERDRWQTDAAGYNEQAGKFSERVNELSAQLTATEAERNNTREQAAAALADLERSSATAKAAVEAAIADRDAADASSRADEAAKIVAEQRSEQAEREKAATSEALERFRQSEAARTTAAVVAQRGLIADVMRRLIERETERARSRQQSPDKLRAWVATFYETFEPAMVEALIPAVRVHLAWQMSSDDPRTVATGMARAHCEASIQQLRTLAEAHPDDMQVALSAVLERWERDRPEAAADAVMRDALARVQSMERLS